jgi:hypothetical protein
VLPPNLWWVNKPGSTLFMPVADASEEALGRLALMIPHGVTLVDQETGEPAGDLEPFVRSRLLDRKKRRSAPRDRPDQGRAASTPPAPAATERGSPPGHAR